MSNTVSIELPQNTTGFDESDANDMPIDLKSLANVVFKRFWLIAISAFIVFSTIAYVTFNQTPIYKSEVVVIVDSNQMNVINLGSVLGGGALNTPALDTEVRVMGSKTLLRRVVLAENLMDDPEFNYTLHEPKVSMLDNLRNQIGGLFSSAPAEPEEEWDPFEGMTAEEREEEILESVVGALMGKVRISRVGTTYLISAEVTTTSGEKSARIANAIAKQYSVDQMEAKLEATRRATEWLSERVSVLRDEVSARENAVEEFRNSSGLLAAQGTSLTESNVAMLQQQKIQLEGDLTRARARYNSMRRQIDSGAGVDSIAEVLESPVISNLKAQRAQVQRRLAELSSTLGPQHPDIVSARSEDADIERQIRAEVQRIASSIESEVRVAEDQIATLNAQIGQNRARLIRDNTSLVTLRELERDAEASRAIYEEFIDRFQETRQQDDLVEADARVLSSASVPAWPSAPRTKVNLLIGLILGGVIGGLLALIAEIFDAKISSTEDVERRLRTNALGTVPLISNVGFLGFGKKRPADYLVDNPLSGYAESIRYLRVAIVFSDIDSKTKTVAVTSSLPDEGKTSLTLSLGRMSAMSGSRTLVIDGDFRRRQLTEAAGIDIKNGFVEYLFGESELAGVIQKDTKSDLDILPLSMDGHTPHDVFGTQAFDELHEVLRSQYDLILIDTGPLLLMAEARVIAGKADKTILVVRWRKSTRAVVKRSLGLLKTFRAELLGVVLNMVDLDRRRQHNEPGTAYRDYKKYYMSDSKPGLLKGRGRKAVAAKIKPAIPAKSATPAKPAVVTPKAAEAKPAETQPAQAKPARKSEVAS